MRHIPEVVPGKRLVAAVAAERDGDVRARRARHVPRRDRRRVGHRLAAAEGRRVEHLVERRLDEMLVVAAP